MQISFFPKKKKKSQSGSGSAAGRGDGATRTGRAVGGNGASRKSKVVVVSIVKKVMERIAAKKQNKNFSGEYVFIIKQLC